jgi:hypothetical protein
MHENLWKPQPHPGVYIVTTNFSVNRSNELVMGRGAALEAKNRIPGIAAEAGDFVIKYSETHRTSDTGKVVPYCFHLLRNPRPDEGKYGFGLFQVKWNYDQKADLGLINCSMVSLRYYCLTYPHISIRMNYPGIGFGQLPRSEVNKIVESFIPDNLTICYL